MLLFSVIILLNLYICCVVSISSDLLSETFRNHNHNGGRTRLSSSSHYSPEIVIKWPQSKEKVATTRSQQQINYFSGRNEDDLVNERSRNRFSSARQQRQANNKRNSRSSSSSRDNYSLANRSDNQISDLPEYITSTSTSSQPLASPSTPLNENFNSIIKNELEPEEKDELEKIEMHTNNHQQQSVLINSNNNNINHVAGAHNSRSHYHNTYPAISPPFNNNKLISQNSFGNNLNLNYIHSLLINSNSNNNNNMLSANSLSPYGHSLPNYNSNSAYYSAGIPSSTSLTSSGVQQSNSQKQHSSSTNSEQQQQHELFQLQNQVTVNDLNSIIGPSMQNCGRQQVGGGNNFREPRIVGGNDTYEGEFPWAVSIQRHGNHHCGGVIVGKRWILTAAHCVRSQLVGNLIVRTGGHTLTRSPNSLNSHLERDYFVDQIVMHGDFSRYDNLTASQMKSSANTNNADIALLRLKHEISWNEFAWPVCFPHRQAGNFSGHDAVVIGWGKLNEKSEDFSNELQKVKLTIIDNKVCQNWFRQAGRDMPIDDRIICAGFKNGGKDACHGDSGGPLLSKINGNYVVVGVVSTGIGCARPLLPGLYSRVSSYIGWIEKYVIN